MSESEAPEPEPLDFATLQQANAARRLYLAEHGAPPPSEQQYIVSLLEFMIAGTGGEELLAKARIFHEVRVAPILDSAVEKITEVEERRQSAATRASLLKGVDGGRRG